MELPRSWRKREGCYDSGMIERNHVVWVVLGVLCFGGWGGGWGIGSADAWPGEERVREAREALEEKAEAGVEAMRREAGEAVERAGEAVREGAAELRAASAEAMSEARAVAIEKGREARAYAITKGEQAKALAITATREARAIASDAAREAGEITAAAEQAMGQLAADGYRLGEEAADVGYRATLDSLRRVGRRAEAGLAEYVSLNSRLYEAGRPIWARLYPSYGSADDYAIIRGSEYDGALPVWYINGMHTSRERGEENATMLADHLHRPVYFIHNTTKGWVKDSVEASADRLYLLVPAPLQDLFLSDSAKVLNAVLREHARSENPQPMCIVSHSQGCLVVRNAFLFAMNNGRGEYVQDNVHWVAMGVPMVLAEVRPRPAEMRLMTNRRDYISRGIGGRVFVDLDDGHGHWASEYIELIDPEWLR